MRATDTKFEYSVLWGSYGGSFVPIFMRTSFLTARSGFAASRTHTHMKLWHDMRNLWQKALVPQPRWDGNRVLFAIESEGRRVQCAITRSALQHLSGHPHIATRDLLRRFVDSRERVEEIAARIFHIMPKWVSGPVSIWADDIDDPLAPDPALAREIVPLMGGVRCDLCLVS